MKLFTCRWLPVHCEPKALIFLCHGYAMESTTSMKGQYLASANTDISIIKTTLILSSPSYELRHDLAENINRAWFDWNRVWN